MDNTEQKILKNLTIMYIEDEESIRQSVVQTLQMIFKSVVSFQSAEEALEVYKKTKPDIILSDISLPQMSGLEFAKIVREDDYNIPIILLTAYTSTEFLLEATKLKLVNYITKPVVFDELYGSFKIAVQDILRNGTNILKFSNDTIYDLSTKLLYENDKEIHLTASENKLLDIFIQNIDKTISTEDIKDQLWDDPYDATDSALKSVLNKLRSKIGKNSIKNVSGMGYYLVATSDFK
jgi:DNA-binding response OmpR family regulator